MLSLAANQTYKGQQGYLVTITSQDEQNFIKDNTAATNIIIALTDRETEGVFKWVAGPEAGTVVRSGGTNVPGMYNGWCSGEPNNGGGGEDYVVTKWCVDKGLIAGSAALQPWRCALRVSTLVPAPKGVLRGRRAQQRVSLTQHPPALPRALRPRNGGNCWNDYGPPTIALPGEVQGYVIEFGTWATASDNNFTDFYEASVTHSILAGPASVPHSSGAVESGLAGVAANCDTPSSAYMNTTLTSNALKAGAL